MPRYNPACVVGIAIMFHNMINFVLAIFIELYLTLCSWLSRKNDPS
jgi:hypothetical protein